jgi:hypothetical protein
LTLALDSCEWSASRPGSFSSRETSPSTHWIGGCVGPSTSLDYVEWRKIFPLLGLEIRPLGRLGRSQSLYRLCYPGSITKKCHHKTWLIERVLVPNRSTSLQKILAAKPYLAKGTTFRLEAEIEHRNFLDTPSSNNSIQFNSLLFMCRVNSYKAKYRHSTV